jgi:hypothetical protein
LKLRSALANYADGIANVDASDSKLVAIADALRQQLETVYGQRITFKGEQREPSGAPLVVGTAEVKRVSGLAAGVIAVAVTEGEVRGNRHRNQRALLARPSRSGRADGVAYTSPWPNPDRQLGCGWVQREGGPVEEIRPGDLVWFPPGEKHWHGATPTTAMTHSSMAKLWSGWNTSAINNTVVDWRG